MDVFVKNVYMVCLFDLHLENSNYCANCDSEQTSNNGWNPKTKRFYARAASHSSQAYEV